MGGGPEIWLTDRQMFALRGDSMSLGIGGGGGNTVHSREKHSSEEKIEHIQYTEYSTGRKKVILRL